MCCDFCFYFRFVRRYPFPWLCKEFGMRIKWIVWGLFLRTGDRGEGDRVRKFQGRCSIVGSCMDGSETADLENRGLLRQVHVQSSVYSLLFKGQRRGICRSGFHLVPFKKHSPCDKGGQLKTKFELWEPLSLTPNTPFTPTRPPCQPSFQPPRVAS